MRAAELWMLAYAMNALWQVPLVFAAAWTAARVARRSGPELEHRVWVGALLLEALVPACSFRSAELLGAATAWLRGGGGVRGAQVTVVTGEGVVRGGLQVAPAWLTVAVALYGCGVLYFATRLAFGLWRTEALRRRATAVVLTGEAAASCARYARAFGVTDAQVTESAEIAGPLTLGVRRRELMLPVDAAASLRAEDLDAALAHEFAHMRRRDYAKNLVYEALSLPVALHPVTWLTRRHVAASREMVCDALAADAVLGRKRYVRSLLRLAMNLSVATSTANVHAIGIFDANHAENFERRIMNLTGKQADVRGVRRAATVAACVLLGAVACTSAVALRMQVATPATLQGTAAPGALVVGVPRSANGYPMQSFMIETLPATGAAKDDAPTRIRVLTPPTVEAGQTPGTMQVPSGVMAGNMVSKVQPVYPQAAKDAKVQGGVVLNAVIGKDGTIASLKVVAGPEELRASAWEAVKQWTYKPYLLNGKPTEVETTITVNYKLAGE